MTGRLRGFVALLCTATLMTASPTLAQDLSSRGDRPVVHLSPNPARLHHRLSVTVTGLRPGTRLRFALSRIPANPAFGGPVGTFYANGKGSLRFSYPPFEFKQEIGLWRVVGYRTNNGSIAVSAQFRVVG